MELRAGETRWSLHYDSICSLLRLCKPTYLALKDIANTKGQGTKALVREKVAGGVALIRCTGCTIFTGFLCSQLNTITAFFKKKMKNRNRNIIMTQWKQNFINDKM